MEKSMGTAQVLILFCIFVLMVFLIGGVKKIYYRYVLKKRYFVIPRVSSKGIANIGMVISLSISVVLLLTIITADFINVMFRTWAGVRVIVEGILIKIGGLLFGPIIGLCIGASIDFFTVALSGGVFHYGYLIGCMTFGLIAGFIGNIYAMSNKNDFKYAVYSTLTLAIFAAINFLFIYLFLDNGLTPNSNRSQIAFNFSLLGVQINLGIDLVYILGMAIFLFALGLIWICYMFQRILNKSTKKNDSKWYITFIPVFVTIVITELIVNVIMMPAFDASISTLTYEVWFCIRLLMFVPMVLLNLAIIYPVFRIVTPLIKYNYEEELVENLNEPIYIY